MALDFERNGFGLRGLPRGSRDSRTSPGPVHLPKMARNVGHCSPRVRHRPRWSAKEAPQDIANHVRPTSTAEAVPLST